MSYISTGINESAVIVDKAGAVLESAALKLIKRDGNGKFAVAGTAGERVVGVAIATTADKINADDDLVVQIKDIGYVKAGAAIAKGTEIQTDAAGLAIPAVTEKYVIGEALTAASAAGEVIQMQITKSGYKKEEVRIHEPYI